MSTSPTDTADAPIDAVRSALARLTDPEIPVITLEEMGILRDDWESPDTAS